VWLSIFSFEGLPRDVKVRCELPLCHSKIGPEVHEGLLQGFQAAQLIQVLDQKQVRSFLSLVFNGVDEGLLRSTGLV
jgi:hypothetical protein